MNCLKCMTEIENLYKLNGVMKCSKCEMEYFVVESIPIMVNASSDFYRYNRKFRRLVELKNEEN